VTFLKLTDLDAADLDDDLFAYLAEWDADAGYIQMPEGDMLGPDGLRA
jgi:hypothetical protein